MSLDLFQQETSERLAGLPPVQAPDAGFFDDFARGTGMAAMRSFAKSARAVSMVGALGPIASDFVQGGTEAQDRYFKQHDDTFQSAVDYWTPRPNEVGTAAEVVGQLLGTLPLVFASPSFTVASTQLASGEDLARQGADTTKAQAVGAAQGAGLGLGIWMPILGQNLWQRTLIGGAGFNVVQGMATRGASSLILAGTPQAKAFEALDPEQITLDVLLGLAFGAIVHINPKARKEGAEMWGKIRDWAQSLEPSQVAAIATLREAQHLNVDSAPGRPVDTPDLEAHVQRMRQAIDQMERGQPVDVENIKAQPIVEEPLVPRETTAEQLPDQPVEPRFEPDQARQTADAERLQELAADAERVRVDEGLPPLPEFKATSLIQEIRRKGGIQLDQIRDLTGEGRVGKGRKGLPPGLFTKNGRDLGDLATQLRDEGWDIPNDPVDGGVQALRDQIQAELAGEKQYSIADTDRLTAHEYETRMIEESYARIDEQEVPLIRDAVEKAGMEPTPENVVDVDKVARASALDEAAVETAAKMHEADDVAFMREIDKILKGAEQAKPAAEVDPLAQAADAVVARNPEQLLVVGKNADGTPVTKTTKQYLDDARADVEQARQDLPLFEAAAKCLFGGGA